LLANYIFLLSLSQLVLYFATEKLRWQETRKIIFLVFALAYLFILPRFFYTHDLGAEGNCTMPVFALNLFFWTLGLGSVVGIHAIYNVLRLLIVDKFKIAKR